MVVFEGCNKGTVSWFGWAAEGMTGIEGGSDCGPGFESGGTAGSGSWDQRHVGVGVCGWSLDRIQGDICLVRSARASESLRGEGSGAGTSGTRVIVMLHR